MSLDDVLKELNEESSREALLPGWESSQKSFPAEVPFLNSNVVEEIMTFGGFDAEAIKEVQAFAQSVAADPAQTRMIWHLYWVVYKGEKTAKLGGWPTFESALGAQHRIFPLLVGLAMIPLTQAYHKGLGVSEDITRATCQQVRNFCENVQRGCEGKRGYYTSQLNWMRHYTCKPYFRLGRMEYWLKDYRGGCVAFKNRKTGEVIALSDDGARYNREGYVDGTAGNVDELAWSATIEEREDATVGYPISPYGMAVHQKIVVPHAEWEKVLEKGMPILDMHIPPGGGLKPEACRDSQQKALKFFDEIFPDKPFTALVCHSWMFNTQLQEILSEDANLVKYMRELYLLPVKSTGQDGLWFIFLKHKVDASTFAECPRDSSLQRAVLDFLEAGNTWRGGAMFMHRDDVKSYGEQVYRKAWPSSLISEQSK